MSELSKLFYEKMDGKTCADVIHPSLTCFQSAKIGVRTGVLGAARFYFPICFVIDF